MSSPLAIGAVSAVLRNLLDNGMVEAGAALGATVDGDRGGARHDRARRRPTSRRSSTSSCYQVDAEPGLAQSSSLPSRNGAAATGSPTRRSRSTCTTWSPRTAQADFQAEILLGYAMHLLHERPVLDRAAIRRALDPSPLDVSMLPPAFQALAASDLADQVEPLKITPTADDDRGDVEAVVGDPVALPAVGGLPGVGRADRGAAPGTLAAAGAVARPTSTRRRSRDRGVVVDARPAAAVADAVRRRAAGAADRRRASARRSPSSGVRLDGTGPRSGSSHPLLVATPIEIAVAPNADGKRFTLRRCPPTPPRRRRARPGMWRLSLRRHAARRARANDRATSLPFVLAPDAVIAADAALGLAAASATRAGVPPTVRIVLAARPQVRPQQRAVLMLDASRRPRSRASSPTDLLAFVYPDSLPPSPPAARGCACASTASTACCSTAAARRRSSTRVSSLAVPA